MRAFVTIEIGAKNEVLDPVYQLSCLPSWSKPLSYRKFPIDNGVARESGAERHVQEEEDWASEDNHSSFLILCFALH